MIELNNPGPAVLISAAINVLAMLIGSYGLWDQISIIWRNRSATSVSLVWMTTYMFMFASFVVYGWSIGSGALMVQVVRVVLLLVVVVGIVRFTGGLGKIGWLSFVILTIAMVLMVFSPEKKWFFLAFSLLGGIAAADQPHRIWRNKNTGQVSYKLIVVYNIAAAAWIVYGLSVGDYFVTIMGVLYVVINTSTMVMFKRYKKNI